MHDNFNAPGFLHYLSGNSLESSGKFRITELLEGGSIKFYLDEPSLVIFYLDLPEGLDAVAELLHIDGTYATKVSSKNLNKNDLTFLRQEDGF